MVSLLQRRGGIAIAVEQGLCVGGRLQERVGAEDRPEWVRQRRRTKFRHLR